MYFTEIYAPRLGDYDRNGKLSYESLLQILENVGTHQTMAVADQVAANGIAWVLVDWRIEITRRPQQFQVLHVKTWVHGRAPANTAYRSFIVEDDQGQEFLRASAIVVLRDMTAQRLIRISEELFQSYEPESAEAFEDKAPRLREPEAYDAVQTIPLRRSDIDYNGHVHNTRYLDFVQEALPEADYAADTYTKIRIIYRTAIQPDSLLEIKRVAVDGGYLFGIFVGGEVCTLIEMRT